MGYMEFTKKKKNTRKNHYKYLAHQQVRIEEQADRGKNGVCGDHKVQEVKILMHRLWSGFLPVC